MTVDEILHFYPSQVQAADAIGISPQLMSKLYTRRNTPDFKIPIQYQLDWEVASNGKLRADLPEQVRSQA